MHNTANSVACKLVTCSNRYECNTPRVLHDSVSLYQSSVHIPCTYTCMHMALNCLSTQVRPVTNTLTQYTRPVHVQALTESISTNIFMICSVYGSILMERARHKSPTRPTAAKHTWKYNQAYSSIAKPFNQYKIDTKLSAKY